MPTDSDAFHFYRALKNKPLFCKDLLMETEALECEKSQRKSGKSR